MNFKTSEFFLSDNFIISQGCFKAAKLIANIPGKNQLLSVKFDFLFF